jgi:hypothetical protein
MKPSSHDVERKSGKMWQSSLLLVCVALVCNPATCRWFMMLPLVSLPPSWYFVVKFLSSGAVFLLFGWLSVAVMAPLLSTFPLVSPQYHSLRPLIPAAMLVWLISWGSPRLHSVQQRIWRQELVQITQRAVPLHNALESYYQRNGSYPIKINDLLPGFINSIPGTGAVGYPHFEYRRASAGTLFRTYELRVQTSRGFLNWDVFVYWPERQYPARMYGGSIERIGYGAYVHE